MNALNRFLQENNIGDFSKSPLLYIDVYPDDDGNTPHFHVYDINKKIDTCIEIGTNKYFRHGTHKSIITSGKVRKLLDSFLRSKPDSPKAISFKSNWHWIKFIWNSSDQRKKVPNTIQNQPNYTTIKLDN